MRTARVSSTGIIACCCVAVLLLFTFTAAIAGDTLNNESVIEMVKLGLGEPVIIKKINSGPVAFDTGISGLKSLKAAGVSDAIIEA